MKHVYYVGNIPFTERDYLAHHGVRGQKWGVRRYQYSDGSLTPEGRIHYNKGLGKASNTDSTSVKKGSAFVDGLLSGFTNPTSQAMLAITAASLAVSGGIRVGEHIGAKVVKNKYDKERANNTNEIDKKTGFKKKDREYTEEEDLKRVNPEYGLLFDKGTKENCMLCTTTYELRRRGYDVTTNKNSEGFTDDAVNNWFVGAKVVTNKSEGYNDTLSAAYGTNNKYAESVIKDIAKQPEGARGNIMLSFGSGGGHSMIYTVKDGKCVLMDGQTNTVYSEHEAKKIIRNCYSAQTCRYDNLKLNTKGIKEVAHS